jgi:hypothetical protein
MKRKTKRKSKKNSLKIIDIPLSDKKSKGTRATSGNIDFNYQKYKNINLFFNKLNFETLNKQIYNISLKCNKKKIIPFIYNNIIPGNIFTIIIINIDTKEGGHANIALINNLNKTIEYFEPHGYRKNKDSDIAGCKGIYRSKFKILMKLFKEILPAYTLINTVEHKKASSFQSLLDPDENTGFCVMWCILFVHYRLLNQNILISKLIKHIDKFMSTNRLLKYAKYIEEVVKS